MSKIHTKKTDTKATQKAHQLQENPASSAQKVLETYGGLRKSEPIALRYPPCSHPPHICTAHWTLGIERKKHSWCASFFPGYRAMSHVQVSSSLPRSSMLTQQKALLSCSNLRRFGKVSGEALDFIIWGWAKTLYPCSSHQNS